MYATRIHIITRHCQCQRRGLRSRVKLEQAVAAHKHTDRQTVRIHKELEILKKQRFMYVDNMRCDNELVL